MRRHPWLALVAIISLGLAISVNVAIFGVWNAVMRHRAPVSHPDRLVSVFTLAPTVPGTGYLGVSHLDFLDYAAEPAVFKDAYALRAIPVAVGRRSRTEQVAAELVSPSYFDVLGVPAGLGRVFHRADAPSDGTGALVVVSSKFFDNYFGGDRTVIGSTVEVNGAPFTVLGVAPPGFRGTGTLAGADLWAPMTMHAALLPGATEKYYAARNAQFFSMVARLRPGVSVEEARASVALTGERLARGYPKADAPLIATVMPLLSSGISPNQQGTYDLASLIALSVVAMVLLIACANVGHLLLARAFLRRREMAVRMALGASRARLARQLLAESLGLGMAAGAVGLALGYAAQSELWRHRPPALLSAPLDPGSLLPLIVCAFALALAAAVVPGLAPILVARRLAPMDALRDATTEGRPRGARTRALLLAGEAAFTVAALVLAGLFIASLRAQQTAPLGFDAEHLAMLRFDLASTGFSLNADGGAEKLQKLERQLLDRIRALPGAADATLASGTPMAASALARGYQLFGETLPGGVGLRVVQMEAIAPQSFFRTMGIPLLEGRDFLPTDTALSQPVVIVNASFARREWPGRDAVGQRILFHAETTPTVVVGVAADSKYATLTDAGMEFAYVPLTQEPTTALGLAVRATGSPVPLLRAMRQSVIEAAPGVAVTDVEPAAAAVATSLWAPRLGATLLGLLALLALTLAVIGVYGVAAYSVRQRWRELGIRTALGARRTDIVRLVMGSGLAPVAAGTVAGVVAAVGLARSASALLFGIQPADPVILIGYPALLLVISALALLLPALTASRVDPAATLRNV
ncbi:MAG TPA: ADOP family duplicated permease [Terriglobales bacterium]|nr:ADOP family duplicated permease [Terriglobales bacterium]